MLKRKEARLKEKAERKRKQEQNIALKKDKRDQNKWVDLLLLWWRAVCGTGYWFEKQTQRHTC